MSRDQFLHRQEGVDAVVALAALDPHEAIHVVGNLHTGEVLTGCGVILHCHSEIQAQAADVREGVGRVDGQRRENRKDLLGEIFRQSSALVAVQIGPPDDRDSLGGELGKDRIEQYSRMFERELLGALSDHRELLARSHTVGGANRQTGFVTALEACNPNHVELVEIRRVDREELRPFEQRERRVLRERENP